MFGYDYNYFNFHNSVANFFYLIDLVYRYSNFCGLFKAKAIIVEEQ